MSKWVLQFLSTGHLDPRPHPAPAPAIDVAKILAGFEQAQAAAAGGFEVSLDVPSFGGRVLHGFRSAHSAAFTR